MAWPDFSAPSPNLDHYARVRSRLLCCRVHDLAAIKLGKVRLDDKVSCKRSLNHPGTDYSQDEFILVRFLCTEHLLRLAQDCTQASSGG